MNDISEGDIIYLSPEIFNRKNNSEIDEKSDIFSLGMSILELMSKVNLPKNGDLWRLMRKKEFNLNMLPKEFSENWNININDINEFGFLIQFMICNYDNRKNILELFNIIPELKIRNEKLINNNFISCNQVLLDKIEEEDFNSSLKNYDYDIINNVSTPSNKKNKNKIDLKDFMEID